MQKMILDRAECACYFIMCDACCKSNINQIFLNIIEDVETYRYWDL